MSNDMPLDTERLKAVLEAYGTNEENWPTAERSDLKETLSASPSLDSLYRDQRNLDEFLTKNSASLSAPAHLMGAILQDAEAMLTRDKNVFSQLFRSFFKASPGLILAACLGIYLGVASPNLLQATYDINLDELSVSDTVLDWEFDNGNL